MPGPGYMPAVKVICTDRSRVPVTSWVPDIGRGKSCLSYYGNV